MFEFDEHFAELDALEAEKPVSQPQQQQLLPAWAYVGNDVWKLDFDTEVPQVSREWLLNTADVA